MDQKTQTPKFLRQRKFLTVIPALVLPFLTLAFWALGGGKVESVNAKEIKGFNRSLPGINMKDDESYDKMSYYTQAANDSTKLKELKKNDPYYKLEPISEPVNFDKDRLGFEGSDFVSKGNSSTQQYRGFAYNDPNEQKVYQKLDQLNAALSERPINQNLKEDNRTSSTGINSNDVDRLEKMMLAMQQGNGNDPEMDQLNLMLEKIVNIQNPGVLQDKLRKESQQKRGQVFAVSTNDKPEIVSSLDKEKNARVQDDSSLKYGKLENGFYSFDEFSSLPLLQNSIQAVIHETQILVNGATVKLRLSNDIYINGLLIPKETFLFGTVNLNGDRLTIKINNVRYQQNLFPVELTVFDLDGLEGINVPGAISRDVAKESADRGMQNIGFNSIDPSIGMQAANVGIEAAKGLFSKKVKLVRVTVKAGYQVLLRDEKQKQLN